MMNVNRRQFLKRAGSASALGAAGFGASSGTAAAHARFGIISTRDHYDRHGNLKDGHNRYEYATASVPGDDGACANELTVYVHGLDNDHETAVNSAHDVLHHLMGKGYKGHLAAFSWDSDKPEWDWNSDWGGFGDAQKIAQQNGYALAWFLHLQMRHYCEHVKPDLRLISHSLGAQVVLNALRLLNEWWSGSWDQVATVHLLAAAQDNEAPTFDWPSTYYAIRDRTGATFNYFNREDDVLETFYTARELDNALGETGAYSQNGENPPDNYHDVDVTDQWGGEHGAPHWYVNCAGEINHHMVFDHYFD